jgi:hypothetical protein
MAGLSPAILLFSEAAPRALRTDRIGLRNGVGVPI